MDLINVKIFLVNFVTILGNIITYAIFARILLSWISLGSMRQPGRITYFINDITEPFLKLAKKLPHRIGMIDLSPMITLIGINIIAYILVRLIALI